MTITRLLSDIAATGSVVLIVSIVVTFLYAFATYGTGAVDWETSFRLALTIGIALPLVHRREAWSALHRGGIS